MCILRDLVLDDRARSENNRGVRALSSVSMSVTHLRVLLTFSVHCQAFNGQMLVSSYVPETHGKAAKNKGQRQLWSLGKTNDNHYVQRLKRYLR